MTGARNTSRRFAVELPGWLDVFLAEWNEPLDDLRGRMELAVALSGENVRRGSGGPFGAIVVEEGAGCLLGATCAYLPRSRAGSTGPTARPMPCPARTCR